MQQLKPVKHVPDTLAVDVDSVELQHGFSTHSWRSLA